MLKHILTFCAFISGLKGFSQNEIALIGISGNYTTAIGVKPLPGFGALGHFSMHPEKKHHLIFGFEYNCNRFIIEDDDMDKYNHGYNMKYSMHHLSLPIFGKLKLTKNESITFEYGIYFKAGLASHRKGTVYSWTPDGSSNTSLRSETISHNRAGDIGFMIGGGKEFSIKGQKFFLSSHLKYSFFTGWKAWKANDDSYLPYIKLNFGYILKIGE